MAAKPSRAGSTSSEATQAIDALDLIRLDKNWTYQELAEDMDRAGRGVPAKTLQTLINYRPNPHRTTLYQIQRYLEIVRAREERDATPAPRKAAAAR